MAHSNSKGGADSASPVFHPILEWPIRLAGMISVVGILAVFGLIIYAILQRYLLDTPLKWGDEMLGYLLVLVVMSGTSEALRRVDHIAIDLISSRTDGVTPKAFDVFACVAAIAFCTLLAVSSYETVLFSYDFGSYSPGYLEAPMWLPQLPLVIGAALLGYAALLRLIAVLAGSTKH